MAHWLTSHSGLLLSYGDFMITQLHKRLTAAQERFEQDRLRAKLETIEERREAARKRKEDLIKRSGGTFYGMMEAIYGDAIRAHLTKEDYFLKRLKSQNDWVGGTMAIPFGK